MVLVVFLFLGQYLKNIHVGCYLGAYGKLPFRDSAEDYA